MKVNQSELKDLKAVVTITIEPADYQEEVAKQLKQVRQKAQMPGFRPGMVPAGLVKKMYGKGILADVLNKLVGENLQKHIEDNKLAILGDPLPNKEQEVDQYAFEERRRQGCIATARTNESRGSARVYQRGRVRRGNAARDAYPQDHPRRTGAQTRRACVMYEGQMYYVRRMYKGNKVRRYIINEQIENLYIL